MPGLLTLLDVTLAGAVTAQVSGPWPVHAPIRHLALQGEIVVVGGGTTAKAWVQTSLDGGVSWMDIASFAFTTSSAKRSYNLTDVAVTSIATPSEGTLSDNTAVNGFLGTAFRVKLTTTGTYTGASTFQIYGAWK